MFLVYAANISNRLRYTFRFVFQDLLLSQVDFTKDKEEFQTSDKLRINYSNHDFKDALQFKPHGLLNKKGIEEIQTTVFEWNGTKVFFKVNGDDFPFDPFAATFYLISRYEEYLPHKRDHYNRFVPSNSLAFKNDFLQLPIVDIWSGFIKDRICSKYSNFQFKERKYKYHSTIDIDSAFAYIEKGFVRALGSLGRSMLSGSKGDLKQRVAAIIGTKKDPFDTFDKLHEVQKKYDINTLYFFLMADYGLNDKNVPHTSKKFQTKIKEVADYYSVGIHPSFGSNKDEGALKKEINRLFDISHAEITKSRQHFLKLQFPNTYRKLIEHEITDDYTMGYAAELGFRAGTCTSFYFYDLDREQTTKLRVHPFCVMDASLRHYLNVNSADVIDIIRPYIAEVKKVKGTFTTLWHNESLSGIYPWEGWQSMYEHVVKIARE